VLGARLGFDAVIFVQVSRVVRSRGKVILALAVTHLSGNPVNQEMAWNRIPKKAGENDGHQAE